MAAYRLHQNLHSHGIDSRMLVMESRTGDSLVTKSVGAYHPLRLGILIRKAWLKITGDPDYYFQDQNTSLFGNTSLMYKSLNPNPDIIVVHWVSNFLSIKDLSVLSRASRAPVVWYLMDMAPLTGGCHYAWDCTGYMNRCGRCPALYSAMDDDRSRKSLAIKRSVVQNCDLTVVAGSSWLMKQAQQASVFQGKRIEKIMLSVDTELFRPEDRHKARHKLNLPQDRRIIFFGAQFPRMKRKGVIYLLETLKILATQGYLDKNKVTLMVAGNPSEIRPLFDGVLPYVSLGYLSGDKMLATAYQASDLFVCPSIEDSGPMMINEAILCGTPVVAFAMGVAPDLVITGQTGYCAELKSSEDLARGIRYVLDLPAHEAQSMSEACRRLGADLCHPKVQVESFMRLFHSLLAPQ